MNDFYITVASLPDREHLVAEIFYKEFQWVEISQECEELIIQFYPHPRQSYWEFSYEEAIKILEEAKNKLMG